MSEPDLLFRFALRLDNLFHGIKRLARFEQFAGDHIALSAPQLGIKLQNAAGQKERFFLQVVGRVLLVFQNLHHVSGLQRRAETEADRLRTVGNNNVNVDFHHVAHVFDQLAQTHGFLSAADAGARTDRNVDQQVRDAGGHFGSQNRSDAALKRCQTVLLLHRGNDLVGGGDVQSFRIDDCPAFFQHLFFQAADVQIGAGENLHGIGGAGTAAQGTGDGFGHRQAVGGNDRSNNQVCLVAGNFTQAMVVGHDFLAAPVDDAVAAQGFGQRKKLVRRYERAGRHQERGNIHVGITPRRNVGDNVFIFFRA